MEPDEIKALKDSFHIENILDRVEQQILNEMPHIKLRMDKFIVEFEKEFPYPEDAYRKGGVEVLSWALMGNAFFLYALDLKDSLIVHLHGILERFTVKTLQEQLIIPNHSPTLKEQINRYNLYRSGKILRDFGVIDNETLKFFKELRDLRNAVAHADLKKLSKLVKPKDNTIWVDTHSAVSDIDSISLILNSLKSLVSLYLKSEGSEKE